MRGGGGPQVEVSRAAGPERRVFTHAHYSIMEPRVHLVTRAYLQRLCGVNLAWLCSLVWQLKHEETLKSQQKQLPSE